MARQLRPRKARPSYAHMAGYTDEDGAGPSAAVPSLEDEDSGSDFVMDEAPVSPTGPDDAVEFDGDDDSNMEVDDLLLRDDDSIIFPSEPSGKGKRKAKPKSAKTVAESRKMASLPTTPGLSRSSNRQTYVLPTPSVHHRHRAVSLFTRMGRVERLETPPILFRPAKTIPTNNFTHSASITDRVNKAWGYNVGSGPLWELLEDRSWFKEAVWEEADVEVEEHRRPKVHEGVRLQSGWEILDDEDAASLYLPSHSITTDEGCLKPPPPVACSFGPIETQTRIEMKMFEARKMSEFIPESKSHVFNAGAPVWGVDWCPIHPEDRHRRSYKQYLAVAPFPSQTHSPEIGTRVQRPSHACIQIWSLGPTKPKDYSDNEDTPKEVGLGNHDIGEMICEMVVCVDSGPAHEIKWCPLPSHDCIVGSPSATSPRKLGLLAGTFEDGSMSIYAIPEPTDVTPLDHDRSKPLFVRLPEPLVRVELEETACWTLDWANSEMIAVGCTNGCIAIYDISQALKTPANPPQNLFPTHYLAVHQSAIRSLAWIRAPPYSASGEPLTGEDPTVVASGGYDGIECLWDIREMNGNVMNRTRDVITSMTFSSFAGGPITIDHENIVKAYSASPSMLGRGHTLLEPAGPVWDIAASDYHPQLAVGSADGACSTTNTLRSTRRGGSVPFFVNKIYQLDYSRKSGEYRMLERFLPQVRPSMHAGSKPMKRVGQKRDPGIPCSTGAWPLQVGVHRVVWNAGNGLNAAPLLASGTASGLCRVDWLMGRWLREKIPYGGVVNLRGEVGADEGVLSPDEDGSDED